MNSGSHVAPVLYRFVFALLLLSTGLNSPLFAQSPGPTVKIYIEEVSWAGYIGDEYGPRFRFAYTPFNSSMGALSRITLKPNNEDCLKYGAASNGVQNPGITFNLFSVGWSQDYFQFHFTSHEERKQGSEDCTVQGIADISTRKPDRYEVESTWGSALSNFTPGVWSDIQQLVNSTDGTNAILKFRVMYLPPMPSVNPGIPSQGCANNQYNISAGTGSSEYTNLSGVSYQWQARIYDEFEDSYDIQNCYEDCSGGGVNMVSIQRLMMPQVAPSGDCRTICETTTIPANYHWFTFSYTSDPSVNIIPTAHIFPYASNSENRDPSKVMRVGFQVRAYRDGNYGPWSNEQARDIAPRAPTFSIPGLAPSCTQQPSGQIYVRSVSTVLSDFRYLVKEGFRDDIGCNVANNECFQPGSKSGYVAGSTSVDISGLNANTDYTVFIINSGGTDGICYNLQKITIGTVATLDTDRPSDIALNCFGDKTGVPITFRNGQPSINGKIDFVVKDGSSNVIGSTSTASSPATVPNIPAGSYSIIANDGCTAPQSESITITQPIKVTIKDIDFSVGAATCLSPANGKMNIKAEKTPGALDANYYFKVMNSSDRSFVKDATTGDSWSPTDLAPGNYIVSASEVNGRGCNSSEKNFTINPPPILNVTAIDKVDVLCHGASTGSLQLSGSGGSNHFDYQVIHSGITLDDDPTRAGFFNAIPAGDYQLRVFNTEENCSQTYDNPTLVNVWEPSLISITLTPINISCYGEIDGVITSTVTGGIPKATPDKYEYAWEWELPSGFASMAETTTGIDELEAGRYRLTVTDDNACKMSAIAPIIEPEPLTIANVKVNDIACLGETGTIVVTPAGGTPGFTYEYSLNGGSYQLSTATTPLGVGFYTVRAIDSRLCEIEDQGTYEITLPGAVLDVSLEWTEYNGFEVSCNGGANGEVALTPSGGNGAFYSGYTFQKDTDAYVSDIKLTGFNAGDHAVRVKDARGCVVTKNVTLTQPESLATVEAVKTHVDCFGAATGTLTLNASGGVLPFKYQLESGPKQDAPLFEHLVAANYAFTITDNNKCTLVYNDQIVNLNQPIVIQPTLVDAQCFDASDGTISLAVSGGVAPYQYSMTGQPVTSFVEGLHQGTYEMLVVDDKGCEMPTGNLVINQPDLLVISAVDLHDIVCKDEKGTIEMTSVGGTLPYTYEYSKAGDSYVVFTKTTPLVDDTYNVRVTDAHNCRTFYNKDVVITNPPTPLDFAFRLREYNGYNISCFGGNNGVITISPSGGNGAAYTKYFFGIDGGTYQEQPKLDHLQAGDHTIFVKDERGCVITKDTYLTESSEKLTADVSNQINARCTNEANGELVIAAVGGASPYAYAIDTQHIFQDAPSFAGLAVGDYVITVADINDCRTTVPATIVSVNPPMVLSKDVTDVNCFGGSDGKIDLTVSSGVAPFSYSWDKGQQPQASISGLKKDTYTVTITDAANCKISEAIALSQPVAALRMSSISTTAACWDQSNGSLTALAADGTSPYIYSIDNGRSYQVSQTFSGPVGTYAVLAKDANGCTTSSPAEIKQRNVQPTINFLAATENYALDTLVITEINVPKPDSLNWIFDPAAIVISDDQWNPQLKFSDAGNYATTMISYFGDCEYSLTKNILLSPFDPDRVPDNTPGFKPIVSMQATPNPSTGKFSVVVVLNSERHLSIDVYDITGLIVEKKSWNKTKGVEWAVDISSQPAGMYVVRAITEPDAEEIKVIINK